MVKKYLIVLCIIKLFLNIIHSKPLSAAACNFDAFSFQRTVGESLIGIIIGLVFSARVQKIRAANLLHRMKNHLMIQNSAPHPCGH